MLQAGRLLRQEREARGLNLRQLALETRISTPVLEALERGWRDRLPEGAYLRTMLPLIEQRLELPRGSLDVALPPKSGVGRAQQGQRGGLLQRFTPGSIEVFSSWQGTVLYGLISLGLIYALNLQQQQLALDGLLSGRPIPALPPAEQATPPDPGRSLTAAYPDLRPLQQASRGVAQAQLRSATAQERSSSPGVLQLQLSQPSSIQLSSQSGERSALEASKGTMTLLLQPPFRLHIQPPPPAGAVSWNGTTLTAAANQPGVFQLPRP